MKLKPLLAVVAVLAAASAFVFWRDRAPARDTAVDPRVGQLLIPEPTLLAMRGLHLESNGQSVSVSADASGKTWTVTDYHGLPADFDKLSSTAASLRAAKVVRFVTANPERLERLGFGGDKIELRDASGQAVWSATLGRIADSGGRFIRIGDEKTAYLTDLEVYLDATPKSWAQPQLLSLKAEDVASVAFAFGDGTTLTAKRGDNGAWTAENLPAGRELKAGAIDSALNQLVGLRFTDTTEPAAADAVAAREHARTITITAKDGTSYSVAIGRRPAPPPPPAEPPAATDGASPAPAAPPPAPPPAGPVYAFVSSNRADAPINGMMQKRAFQIGEWIHSSLPASPSALLADTPPAPAAPVANPPATPSS